MVIKDVNTSAGEFFETTLLVELKDGELHIGIGGKGRKGNTCLNWLRIAITKK